MVMQLKESETKLESMLTEKKTENTEVSNEDSSLSSSQVQDVIESETKIEGVPEKKINQDKTCNIKTNNDNSMVHNLKKVTNIENEHLNKTLTNAKTSDEIQVSKEMSKSNETEGNVDQFGSSPLEIKEIESIPYPESEVKKDDQQLNDILRKNIMACMEKITFIQELKIKNKDSSFAENQVSYCRCVPCVSICLPLKQSMIYNKQKLTISNKLISHTKMIPKFSSF